MKEELLETYKFFRKLDLLRIEPQYIMGVPNLDKPFTLEFKPEHDRIVFCDKVSKKEMFFIKRENLIDIFVDDATTIEKRFSVGRMLLVGVFAFAWRKKQKNNLAFITFEYKDDVTGSEKMVIQSEKENSFQNLNNVKYNLLKFWKSIDTTPNHENILKQEDKEHKKLVDKETADVSQGCLIMFIILIIIIVYFMIS